MITFPDSVLRKINNTEPEHICIIKGHDNSYILSLLLDYRNVDQTFTFNIDLSLLSDEKQKRDFLKFLVSNNLPTSIIFGVLTLLKSAKLKVEDGNNPPIH